MTTGKSFLYSFPVHYIENITARGDDEGAKIDLGPLVGMLKITEPEKGRQLLAAAFEAVRILDPDGAADTVFALIEGDAVIGEPIGLAPEPGSVCDAENASYVDGHCRCIVCPRCHHHTGNSHQGHYWKFCKVTGGMREFHFCCPLEPGCELEDAAPAAAQPEDIPIPSPCRWCGTTEGDLVTFASTDDGSESRFCKDVDACYTRKPSPGGRTCPDCGAVGLPVRDAASHCYNQARCAERQAAKAGTR